MGKTPLPPPPATDPETDLRFLHVERHAVQAAIEGLPAREQDLLERDAPDSAFAGLDLERRRLHHRLERLNHKEAGLQSASQSKRDHDKSIRWQAFVDRYAASMDAMVLAGRELAAQQAQIFALVNEAAADGFSPYASHAHLPYPAIVHNQMGIESLASGIDRLRRMTFGPHPDDLYGVTFLDWCEYAPQGVLHAVTAYQAGQSAGFRAGDAWALVLAQRATWCDPTRIPPRPPARQRRRRAPVRPYDDGRRVRGVLEPVA